ncbi:MAG: hypothetical protein JO325_07590 [Solirubrobacterales bacterium]|nr:hypothetical protein [Solirubrobacterales bacterium]
MLGSQIAYQTAYSGHAVVAYDVSEEAVHAPPPHKHLTETTGGTKQSGRSLRQVRQTRGRAEERHGVNSVLSVAPDCHLSTRSCAFHGADLLPRA